MSFLKRIFTTDPKSGGRGEYMSLREQARRAPLPTDRARLLNLAGDLALSLGDDEGADHPDGGQLVPDPTAPAGGRLQEEAIRFCSR